MAGFSLPQRVPITKASIAENAPRIPWDKFITRMNWRNGEHVGLIGPTGQGKTTLLLQLLPMHPYVTVFGTKPRDPVMRSLADDGYIFLERWRELDPEKYPRRVIWPNARTLGSKDIQRDVFSHAMESIYVEGQWTLAIDETWYFDNVLRLGELIKLYLLQARSLGISLVAATQRPAWVPRELYTSATHLFFWRTNEEQDLQSLSGMGGTSSRIIREIVANLERYQTLYVNTRTGKMYRTRVPKNLSEGR